jgi:hypothetical protein
MKVAICTPVYDQPKAGYAHSLGSMLIRTAEERPDLKLVYFLRQGHLLACRNNLATLALNSGADYVLWIDSDMIFPADALVRLVDHGEPIVACNYTTKETPPRPTASIQGESGPVRVFSNGQQQLEAVDVVGLGFALVRADLLRSLGTPVFRALPTVESGLGEDQYLWHRLKERGHRVLVDHELSAHVAHIGDYAYTNQAATHFAQQVRTLQPSARQS